MDMKLSVKRWQDWGNLLLGAWLFVSPWVMQYSSDLPNAIWNAHLLGAAIVVFAAFAVYIPRVWEEALNTALGIWMIVSPWVLGFASEKSVAANAVVVGILVAAFAGWAMVHDKNFDKWMHEHHVTH
ncbi:SPW repeat protein [Paraherbaspirillum soli]|uniref:SPW repeat protein n=1 Tax=Paraherbaspirillum soli TaxID=631222 RepID=A0ABW0MDR0_9BURK